MLTINNSEYNNKINFTAKIIILNNNLEINLHNLASSLRILGINHLNIFSINNIGYNENFSINHDECTIHFVELDKSNYNNFILDKNFKHINYTSLYILRNSNYIDLKNIFLSLQDKNNLNYNLSRGGGQKSHLVSPLELKLNAYLLAIFNFDYKLINNINMFNNIEKNRYLLYNIH